jgi:hypothetical protein
MLTLIAVQPNKEFDRHPRTATATSSTGCTPTVGWTPLSTPRMAPESRRVPASASGEPARVLDVLGEVVDLVGRSGHHSLRQLGFQLVEPLLLGFGALLRTSEVDELIGDESVAQK